MGLSSLSKNTLIVAWSFVAVVAIAALAFVWIYTESVNQRRLENETQRKNAEVAKLVAKSKRELSKDNLDQAEKIATSAMEVEGATQFENAEALLTEIDEQRAKKEQERVVLKRQNAEQEKQKSAELALIKKREKTETESRQRELREQAEIETAKRKVAAESFQAQYWRRPLLTNLSESGTKADKLAEAIGDNYKDIRQLLQSTNDPISKEGYNELKHIARLQWNVAIDLRAVYFMLLNFYLAASDSSEPLYWTRMLRNNGNLYLSYRIKFTAMQIKMLNGLMGLIPNDAAFSLEAKTLRDNVRQLLKLMEDTQAILKMIPDEKK